MKMEKFEDILNQMSKPDVGELRHEEMLAKGITKVMARSRVSLWWVSIPVYLIVAFVIKSFFTPDLSVTSALQ